MTAASAIVNGGNLVTPHFGVEIRNENNETVKKLKYNENAHCEYHEHNEHSCNEHKCNEDKHECSGNEAE